MILINQLVYVVIGPSSFRAATFPSTRGRHRVGVSVGVRRDGRHGTSVSLSRRVVTHHLSERTDRCLCVGGVFLPRPHDARTRVVDHRYRPSTHARAVRRPSSPATVDRRRRRRHSTTRENEREREETREREDRLDRIRASVRAWARGSNRTHRTHRTNPSNPSVGRLTIDPSNRIHSFARSFRFIHRSESEEERRRREV